MSGVCAVTNYGSEHLSDAFFMEAPQAAEIIAKGIEADKGIIAFPWPLRLAVWLASIVPNCLSDLIYGRLPPKA